MCELADVRITEGANTKGIRTSVNPHIRTFHIFTFANWH
jgi:hypothetical protein